MKHAYTVYKLNEHGIEKLHYPATLVSRDPAAGHIAVEAVFSIASADAGAFELNEGDRMVEHFFTDRYYNVFEVSAPDGSLKGYYCNITRPAVVTDSEIRADDLALDISVNPSGAFMLLDEDEFRDLALSTDERQAAELAADELVSLIRSAAWPFERLNQA